MPIPLSLTLCRLFHYETNAFNYIINVSEVALMITKVVDVYSASLER